MISVIVRPIPGVYQFHQIHLTRWSRSSTYQVFNTLKPPPHPPSRSAFSVILQSSSILALYSLSNPFRYGSYWYCCLLVRKLYMRMWKYLMTSQIRIMFHCETREKLRRCPIEFRPRFHYQIPQVPSRLVLLSYLSPNRRTQAKGRG